MADIYVLAFDHANEEKLARHRIDPEEVWQVLANRHLTRNNPKGPEGRVQLIGASHGGRVLTILVDPTDDAAVWRPVTGWDAEADERRLFERYCR